ncbi:MAG: polysaccharide deacetylase family protein [Maribacter sp.]|nr:polysaccharide deacetylase family protein [Maribacter sp.]
MLSFRNINGIAITLLAVFVTIKLAYNALPWWIPGILGLLWLVITIIGSFHMRWDYHLKSLHNNKDVFENHVSLTFDDGPNPEFTSKVLTLLKKYNAHATFFCIGKHAKAYPEIVKEIIAHGHTIGNHTYSHSNWLGFFGTTKVLSELQKTNAIVLDITGKHLRLFRPAFGVTNPNIRKALQKTGLYSIGWSIRSFDTTMRSANTIRDNVLGKISKGDIVLFHDSSEKTMVVLERLLLFLKEQKLQSVTVDRLLQIKAYA